MAAHSYQPETPGFQAGEGRTDQRRVDPGLSEERAGAFRDDSSRF